MVQREVYTSWDIRHVTVCANTPWLPIHTFPMFLQPPYICRSVDVSRENSRVLFLQRLQFFRLYARKIRVTYLFFLLNHLHCNRSWSSLIFLVREILLFLDRQSLIVKLMVGVLLVMLAVHEISAL